MPFHNSYPPPDLPSSRKQHPPTHTHIFLKPHPDCRQTAPRTPVFLRRMWTFSRLFSVSHLLNSFVVCPQKVLANNQGSRRTHKHCSGTLSGQDHACPCDLFTATQKKTKQKKKTSPSVWPLGFITSEWEDPLVTTLFSVLASQNHLH